LGAAPASGYGFDLLLGQYPTPALPGAAQPVGPSPDILAAGSFLNPSNYRVPAPDQVSPYPLQEGVPPGPFARIDGLKGLHAMVHGALGRMPAGDLSEPLPGTAPPAGTAIPVGPEGNLADPSAPILPYAPPPPASDPAAPVPGVPVPSPPPAG